MTCQGDHLQQGDYLKPKYWDARYRGCRRGLYVRWASASATSGRAFDGCGRGRRCVVWNSLRDWQNKDWIKSWQQLTELWYRRDETNLIESQSTSTHEVQFETMISPAQGLQLSFFPNPLLSLKIVSLVYRAYQRDLMLTLSFWSLVRLKSKRCQE